MTKAYNDFIAVTKQQVKFYQSPFLKLAKAEAREQGRWVLAGIHQSALFVLNEEEYQKFSKEYYNITEYYWGKKQPTEEKQLEGQMTIFDFVR